MEKKSVKSRRAFFAKVGKHGVIAAFIPLFGDIAPPVRGCRSGNRDTPRPNRTSGPPLHPISENDAEAVPDKASHNDNP